MMWTCLAIPILLWAIVYRLYGGKTCNKNPDWLWILIVFTIPCIGCETSYYQTLVAQDIPTDNAWDCPDCFWDNPDWNWKGYDECYMINGRNFIFGCWHEELGTKDVRGWDEWHSKPPHPSWLDDNERNEKNPDGSYKYVDGLRLGWMPQDARLMDVYKQYTVVYPDPDYPDNAARRRLEQQDKVMDMVGHYMDKDRELDQYGWAYFFYYPRKFSRDSNEYGPFGSENDSMHYRSNWYDENYWFMRLDASMCWWVNGDHVLSGCWHDEKDFGDDQLRDTTLAYDEWPGEPPSYDWLVENRKNRRNSDGSLVYPNGFEDHRGVWRMPTVEPRSENRSNHVKTEW